MTYSSSRQNGQSRTIFRTLLVALTILSGWRICICLVEYDAGPFVSVSRTLIDETPFFALAGALAGYFYWNRPSRLSTVGLLGSASVMLISTADLVAVNWAARERIYAAPWEGLAYDPSPGEAPLQYVGLTFTEDRNVVIVFGDRRTEIFQGRWEMSFNAARCNQAVKLPGFGEGDYWNLENLRVRGTFTDSDHRQHLVWVQLRQVAKAMEAPKRRHLVRTS